MRKNYLNLVLITSLINNSTLFEWACFLNRQRQQAAVTPPRQQQHHSLHG